MSGGTFDALRIRSFRHLWLGQLGASTSQWMEQLARPFLIYSMTGSALYVGLIAATRMVPMLFVGLLAGVLADRTSKKRILLISQSITLVSHAVTAALILTDTITPWMVFAGTLVTGTAQVFNQPARQSLIPRLVPKERLQNALALNSAAVNTTRMAGPAVGGLILSVASYGHLYALQSLLYVWVLWSTSRIVVDDVVRAKAAKASLWHELREGAVAVKNDRVVLSILVLCVSLFVFGMPFQNVFIPLIAVEALALDERTAGLLISVVGAGALCGALIVAKVGDAIRRRGQIMIGMIVLFSVALFVFAQGAHLVFVVPALLVCGAMKTSFMSLTNAYVLHRTPPELHGRVVSFFHLDRGLIPAGAALSGALADTLGARSALTIMAALCLTSTLIIVALAPEVRRIE